MSEESFLRFQKALPDKYAEEAYYPRKNSAIMRSMSVFAACLALALLYFAMPIITDWSSTQTTVAESAAEEGDLGGEENSISYNNSFEEAAPEAAEHMNEAAACDGAIALPANATNVELICADGDPSFEEAIFLLESERYTVQYMAVEQTELDTRLMQEVPFELLIASSGISAKVNGCPAVGRIQESGAGQLVWLDGGVFYCLTKEENTTLADLIFVAEQVSATRAE